MKVYPLFFVSLILAFLNFHSNAQITQVEIFSGFHKSGFNYFSIQPLDTPRNFSLASVAFFERHHREKEFIFNVVGVQGTLFWNIRKRVSIGPGLYYNSSTGLQKKISILYVKSWKNMVAVIVPSLGHLKHGIDGELTFQVQFNEKLKQDWGFFILLQGHTNWHKFSSHLRSFQRLRIGPYYETFQFGLAGNLDQYGPAGLFTKTVGVFVRKDF